MKKVFVTGATGFLGKNILPILIDKEFEVHAVYNSSQTVSHHSVQWHQADLMNKKNVSNLMKEIKPEYLIHLAWYVTPGKWAIAPQNLDWVEVSINLIKEFHNNGGKRLVSAGSGLEYDWRYGYCNEELTPANPATFYGVCKNSLKNMIEEYSKLVGLSSAWGRIFFLYGPYENEKRLIAYVINSLLKGEEAKCSHGNQVRDFLHAYDAANALVFLLENNFEGTVNIASGEPIKLKELMLIAAKKLGKENLLKLGAIPAAASDTDLVVADVNKLKNELGWQQKYTNASGIADTIEWWRKELKI
jgi:nucleoside-diphosphate-sugar epimerase